MATNVDWDKFHTPDCPDCKTDTFVEEISSAGAYICRACGTSMTDNGMRPMPGASLEDEQKVVNTETIPMYAPDSAKPNWSFAWRPYGKCVMSNCVYYSTRCEFGHCKKCCGEFHGKIPHHIVPPAWQSDSTRDTRLPAHYADSTREPRLGAMEEAKEEGRHD